LLAGVGGLVAVMLVAAIALVARESGPGRPADAPAVSPSAAAVAQAPSTQPPTPKTGPTVGEFVPPLVSATPTTRKASPTPTKASPTRTVTQRPPCPIQLPMARDWCIRHGYAPPKG
jgi:hypothetical protein